MRALANATAFALLLLAAACGGDSGTATEEPAATEAATPAATEAATDGGAAAGTVPSGGDDSGVGGTAVSIVDISFQPADLPVAAGATVTWTNGDGFGHTVTFDDGEDSGTLQAGDTYERTFDAAGEFPYHCNIHSAMQGTVTVT